MGLNYFFYFCFFGVMIPFLTPALVDLGFDKAQTGLIIAGLYGLNTIMPIIGGRLSDTVWTTERTLRIGAVGMTTFAAILWLAAGKISPMPILVLLFCMGIFRGPMIPMLDSLAMQSVNGDPKRFSRLRMMGSIGFVVTVVIAGAVFDRWGYSAFFTVIFFTCLLFLMATTRLPKGDAYSAPERAPGFWSSLKPMWWLWLGGLFFHWLAFAPYHYGYTLFLQEQGIPERYSGMLWALGVAAETGFFLISGWFFKRFSFSQVLVIACGANMVRWLIMIYAANPWTITLAQLLHGPGFALFYAAAVQGITHYCGGVNRSSYQGLFSTFVGGGASIIGSSLAGYLHQGTDFAQMLLWFLPFQILAAVILGMTQLKPWRSDPVQ